MKNSENFLLKNLCGYFSKIPGLYFPGLLPDRFKFIFDILASKLSVVRFKFSDRLELMKINGFGPTYLYII